MITPRDMAPRRAPTEQAGSVGGQRFGRITDRKPSGSGPGGRFGTYYIRDDETGAACTFSYADIVTEGVLKRHTLDGSRQHLNSLALRLNFEEPLSSPWPT